MKELKSITTIEELNIYVMLNWHKDAIARSYISLRKEGWPLEMLMGWLSQFE